MRIWNCVWTPYSWCVFCRETHLDVLFCHQMMATYVEQPSVPPPSWLLCCVWEGSEWRYKDKANSNTSELGGKKRNFTPKRMDQVLDALTKKRVSIEEQKDSVPNETYWCIPTYSFYSFSCCSTQKKLPKPCRVVRITLGFLFSPMIHCLTLPMPSAICEK